LLIAQFLGAANDNMFRWLVVPIGKEMVASEYRTLALAAGLAFFVAPYILLAATAGYLADRFSKRTVIIGCKVAELAIMLLGVGAILAGSLYLMFGVVALMGAQSVLFGPSKFGSIPEIVRSDRISAANGLIAMTTVLAIMVGTVAGNCLYVLTRPLGLHHWWISAVALIGVAGAGVAASFMIAPLRSANPTRRFPFNAARQTIRDLTTLGSDRPLLRAALGGMMFWTLGALAQMTVDQFVGFRLGLGQVHVGVLLTILVVGVGTGSVLAGVWSAGRVELGIVSLGSAGIAVSSIILSLVSPAYGAVLSPSYIWACVWLLMLGISAGLYQVPIQAFLQYRSRRESRGSILAASNLLTAVGMLLAAGVFWLCTGPLGLGPGEIFLVLGIATVPVFLYVVCLLPGATLRVLVWLLSHTVYRVRVQGRENLPEEGGALLVANHVSLIDGVLMLLHAPRPIRMIARTNSLVDRRWFRWMTKDLGIILIETGKKSVVASIQAAREALLDGHLVCIFPEGHMTRDGRMGDFRRGFLSVVKDTDVPVIPVYLAGFWGSIFSYERGKLFRKWPRRWPYRVSILVGQPILKPSDVESVRHAVVSLGVEAGDLSETDPPEYRRG
jgi:acyl-[acyl-carrier-protein]-phospholipid O-acyltransferase/long-chain-fatty-acid--[acyl-carrier-protein] ligase